MRALNKTFKNLMKTKTIIYTLFFILSSFTLKAQNSLEITLDSKPESSGVLAY